MTRSWLTHSHPPCPGPLSKEQRLWWAIVRQAARDVVRGHESLAWDGAEFLATTGAWLLDTFFGVAQTKTKQELVRLMKANGTLKKQVVAACASLNG